MADCGITKYYYEFNKEPARGDVNKFINAIYDFCSLENKNDLAKVENIYRRIIDDSYDIQIPDEFRKAIDDTINNINEDISNEELETIINPFYDNYHDYVEEYVMPEVIAYYIANSYYRNAMYEGSFLQHYNSAKDLINLFGEN